MKSISKIRHIQESNLSLEKRYLNEQTVLRNGETLNDAELKQRACQTWDRYKSISKPEEIQKAKNWTKQFTKTQYPYDIDVVCKSTSPTSGIQSDGDRKILKGFIELAWVK